MRIFRLLNLVRLELSVWINLAGLNNLGRPWFELGSAHEKFGVWTGPNSAVLPFGIIVCAMLSFATLEARRKLDRVDYRKTSGTVIRGSEKQKLPGR